MFESLVVMLREGIEASLVVAILLVVLKRCGRRDLERFVFWGVGLAVMASIGTAVALHALQMQDDAYEGGLYLLSALFVGSMMWWMRGKARGLRGEIEQRVRHAVCAGEPGRSKGGWALGAFAFLMVFREGAEAVMFLSAVDLNTDAMLSFIGSLLGLAMAVGFCVMFVRGSLKVDLRRFFTITEWVLAIFVAQLLVNGYHEFAEVGLLPATQRSMALVGPIVRNNSLFILALVALPLFIWLTRTAPTAAAEGLTGAEARLALAARRRERFYRRGAIATSLLVLAAVGGVYAAQKLPKKGPTPERVKDVNGWVSLPATKLADGQLHHFDFLWHNRLVRFLAMKTSDGRLHVAMDACQICGSAGYVQEGKNLVCRNCESEINPLTLGRSGGCNPIPLAAQVTTSGIRIAAQKLKDEATLFPILDRPVESAKDPVCGMALDPRQAAGSVVYRGKTYYFCSQHCRKLFLQDPSASIQMK